MIAASLSNVEAEAALLGALMCDNRHIDQAADRLKPEDFAEPVMGRIFSAIVMEHGKGRAANPVTLKPALGDDEGLKELGGIGYLAQLTGSGMALIGARDFIEQISALAQRRRLVEGLDAAVGMACDPASSVEMLIDAADKAIVDASAGGETLNSVTGAEAVDALLKSYDEPKQGATCTTIPSVDYLLGPLRPKKLYIGAGRPGMGKTAFAVSYALGAVQNGHGTLFVSLEMGSMELAGRMVSDLCFDGRGGVPYENIRDGNLTSDQMRKVIGARDMLKDMPLKIVDAGKMTIGRLGMIVRRHKRRMAARGEKLELVIIDYLQLLSADGKPSNRNEAVGEISRGLKMISKDQDVAVLALAQLSREVEKRPDKRPVLSDLRESGSIEQDADSVLFLYRHEYYLRQDEPEQGTDKWQAWNAAMKASEGRIEFICEKRRDGRTGARTGEFWGGNQAVRG